MTIAGIAPAITVVIPTIAEIIQTTVRSIPAIEGVNPGIVPEFSRHPEKMLKTVRFR
jgi:predicted PurR-regulated permease PerM